METPTKTVTDEGNVPRYQHTSLTDTQAERIGATIAADFGFTRARDHADRWQTENGTFTNKGIARRAVRLIEEGMYTGSEISDEEVLQHHDKGVMARAKIELAIVRRVLRDFIAAGYSLVIGPRV